MEESSIMLKPWTHQTSTKSKQCCLQMLRKTALIDLFKCMGKSCAFTTADGMDMEHHLLEHEGDRWALYCAYCTTAATTPRALVYHIREIHGQCRFQCLFCFYRAFEAGNVLYHQHYHHSALKNVKATIVELPRNERQPQTDYLIGICSSFQSNHKLLTCTICQTKHASISLFNEHVYQHRENAIICPICSIQILKQETMDHLNHHRTDGHKCLYCNTMFESKELMYRHLSDCHLNKAMFYALKMQRFDKSYDIFVLENLRFDVPHCRILLATYVNGGMLLIPKMTPDTYEKTSNEHMVINRVQQTDLPKIVKVQGGIVFSEDGSILLSTDSILMKSIEPEKLVTDTQNPDTAVSTPSVIMDAKPSNYPITLKLAKTVAAINADTHVTRAVAKSNAVEPVVPEANKIKPFATLGSVADCTTINTLTTHNTVVLGKSFTIQYAKDDQLTEARDVDCVSSTPSIRLLTSGHSKPGCSPIALNLPKTVTPSVNSATDFIVAQPPVNSDKHVIRAVAKSNTDQPIVSEANKIKTILHAKPFSKDWFQTEGLEVTKTTVSVAATSKVGPAISGLSTPGAVSTTAKNIADVVGPAVNIATVATHPDRASTLDMQPPVSNSDSDYARKVISTHNVINQQNFESMRKTNSQLVLNSSKIVAKNSIDATSASKVRSLDPGPSTRASVSTVARTTDCAVSASVVGADVSKLKHGTGTSSIKVKKTKTDSTESSAAGSGPKKPKHIDINVKDFGSKTSLPLPEPNGNRNSTVSRTCVKLTRLEDGSMVLKFPSLSNPTTTPPVNTDERMARIVSTSNAVKSVMSEGNKVKTSATLVSVADSIKTRPPTTHNTVVHAKVPFIRQAKDEQKNSEDTGRCGISFQKWKPYDNANILKVISTEPKIDMVGKDLPTWNKYGIDLNSFEMKDVLFHWPFLADRIDIFYRSLTSVVARNKMKEVDCFVCGVKHCQHSFLSISSLKIHMTNSHLLLKMTTIACKQCDCVLCGIDAYVSHMEMHIMCRFVCFMCHFSHFLLDKIAEHMKDFHKCKATMLSFVHPQHVNPLKDLIIVMPSDINPKSFVKYMNLIIQSSDNEALVKSHWLPKQANITDLYNCGFCKKALGNKLSLKKHLLVCGKRNDDYYPCAHCEMRFINWTIIFEGICRHLYFHGENLYECTVCEYKHYVDRNVLGHTKKHSESYPLPLQPNIVRESKQLWKCSLCLYRTTFQQGVMEHIQCEHNLPGERFMCSLCYGRMLTPNQTVDHCVYRHHGKQLTMIEMYHPETNDCNETSINLNETQRESILYDISYEKVNNIKAQQLVSRSAKQHVNPGNDNTSEAIADYSSEPSVDVIKDELEIIESNEAAKIPNARKRKQRKEQKKDKMLDTVLETTAIDVRTCDEAGHEHRKDGSVGNCDEVKCLDTNCMEPKMKRQRRDRNSKTPSLSPLCSPSSSSPTSQRRASRRVAVMSDTYNRWLESVKYCCQYCKKSFASFSDFKTHGLVRNESENDANEVFCVSSGSQRNFWLLPIARCFYCTEQDTCAKLMLHCREKHHEKSFACIDLADSLKCGLCIYRNESGKSWRFLKHFHTCHEESKINYYEYINESYFEWALSLGRNTLFDGPVQKHVMYYICSICNEENASETSMGMHVAKHVLKFGCPQCHEKFKDLKVLYYHFLAIHLKELVVPPTAPNVYDKQLLEVLMVFQNGLIVSKWEAQHTSIASIVTLKAGFQRHYSEQLRILETYKEALLLPIFTGNEAIETKAEHTCKTFIQHQVAHPVLALKHLSSERLNICT